MTWRECKGIISTETKVLRSWESKSLQFDNNIVDIRYTGHCKAACTVNDSKADVSSGSSSAERIQGLWVLFVV